MTTGGRPAPEPVTGRSIPRYKGKPVRHRLRVYGNLSGASSFHRAGLIVECDAGDFTTTIDGGHTAQDLARLNRQHAGKP